MRTYQVTSGGVAVRSDIGLYGGTGEVLLLSVYGAPQQVKAVLARVAMGGEITLFAEQDERTLSKSWRRSYKMKVSAIGYGKAKGLLWREDLAESTVFWMSPEEKDGAIRAAISRRTIPFLPEWLPAMERLFLKREIFAPLQGWGGVEGYETSWDDEKACDLIVKNIIRTKKGRMK
jgi:hypothetical protein